MLNLNLALAFGLELVALIAFSLWGTSLGSSALTRILFGVAAPLVMAVIWGTFLSPRATVPLPPQLTQRAKFVVFGAAAFALWSTQRPLSAMIFAVFAALNTVFLSLPKP